MSKSKKNLAIFSLIVCLFAMVCSISTFQSKKVFAENELPKVYAKDFVVSTFLPDSSKILIKYNGKETNIGRSISIAWMEDGSNGWPAFDIVKKDGSTERDYFGGWQENTVYSGFNLTSIANPSTTDWVQFTIPVQKFYDVELMEDIVFRRVGNSWAVVLGTYKNTDFTVAANGVAADNNSYIYLTRKGNLDLIDGEWYVFKNQAQTFTAKTADGTTKELTSNYFQLDKTTIYIKFADKALEGCTELTLPDGAYQIDNDGSYRFFENFTFYSAHSGCWSAVKGELAETREVAAACTTDGTKAYYTCSVCGKNYSDLACENEIADLAAWKTGEGKIAAPGHIFGEWVKVTDPTATMKGEIKRVCAADESHVDTFELPALNETDYECIEITPVGCETAGSANFVYTKDGSTFTFEGTLAATGHKIVAVNGKASTCTEYGYKAYYQCSVCEKAFEDENGETAIENVETWKQGAGKLTELSAHAYGEWMSDEKEHWHACSVCGDKKDVAVHEDSDNNGKCDVCEAAVEISTESGCNSSLSSGLSVAVAAILAAGAFVVIKKGRKEE